ncbi:trypsin-like serine protease [Catenulispora sp. NF23]|uniref:Trypsin-like serine protease n=1 Tax=Catenulispora pinistramenti TaxID=2705254 RepID=A0ABS5L3V0_9ACTN|nr:trypsin-like serine protease [Catenulispora pinistramenti]MBS2536626.1 trypsin-like serine protease [Catenulispora pinistramenti]MBS2552997.1 trypsin-like serine protease [Catenulispora pinistramenti]
MEMPEVPDRRSRVARMRQRAQSRKRARARRAAFAAGAAGILVIAGMLGVAFSRPPSAGAATAEHTAAPVVTPVAASSSSTSASAQGVNEAAAAPPHSLAPPPSTTDAAPASATPEPTITQTLSSAAPAAVAPGSTVDSPAQPDGSPSGTPFGGTAVAGVLYKTDTGVSSHFCSASVVHSAAGNLVITAAHCVYSDGPKSDVAFAPGFHDGQMPYGSWAVTKVVVSQNWQDNNDPDEDVAFLQVAPSPSGASLESVTGADQIAFDQGFGMPVTVPAYPQGSDTPITCTAPAVKFSSTQTEWDCRGYPDGTSGAPFLTKVDSSGEKGTVVGVIGGYEQGGDSPDVSYSAYFGSAVQALYQNATS